MKPKETFRQQCIRLNQTITDNDFTYGMKPYEQQQYIDKIFPAHPLMSKTKAYCSHCGSEVHVLTQKECPVCHKPWGKVERVERASRHREREYLCVMTVMEGLQVMRFWCFEYYFRVAQQTSYWVREVERQFIREDGHREGFCLATRPFSYAYDEWIWHSEITIKGLNRTWMSNKMDCRFDLPCELTVIKQTIPRLRRNGLRKSMHGSWYPTSIVLKLLKGTQVEWLWKIGQYALATHIAVNWEMSAEKMASVRICHRNHYRVKDAKMWLDHIDLLRVMGYDIHNAHYVCPKDLKKAHKLLTERRQRQTEREEAEARRKREAERLRSMEKAKAVYTERWGKLLTISLTAENLSIKPLQTVDEFKQEGDAMHHCVFANAYYESKKCLILSAKDSKGNRLATIEYDVKRGSIEQCRAACNAVPARDAEIRALITSHKKDFKRLLKAA